LKTKKDDDCGDDDEKIFENIVCNT